MFEYTRDNHFKFGYERPLFEGSDEYHRDEPFGLRKTDQDRWWCEYGDPLRAFGKWRFENSMTALEITSKAREIGKKPLLFFSGGIDSEVMVRSFMEVVETDEFNIAIIVFDEMENLHDVSYAISFCNTHGLAYHTLVVSIMDYWHRRVEAGGGDSDPTKLAYTAHIAKSFSPQLCTSISCGFNAINQNHEWLPVFGGGECHLVRRGEQWYLSEKERIAAFYRAPINQDVPMIPAFFQYNPENAMSFMMSDSVQNMVRNVPCESTTEVKYGLYQESYPDLLWRPKFTGFERLQAEDHELRTKLKEVHGAYDDVVLTPVFKYTGTRNEQR